MIDNSVKSESKAKSLLSILNLKKLASIKTLVVLLVIFQLIIFLVLINPIGLLSQYANAQILTKIAKLTIIPNETPLESGIIGDNTSLPNIDTLKTEANVNSQIYKDAKDGDYVVAFSTKMIVYRDSESRIIYEGPTPTQLIQKNQIDSMVALIAKAKADGVISSESTEIPVVQEVNSDNIDSFKAQNSDFYGNAKESDLVVIFTKENKILLYRIDGNQILKSGTIVIK